MAAVQLELKHPADKNEKPKVLCVVQVDHQPELVVVASESWLKFCNTPLLYGTKSESSRDLIAKSSSTDTVSMEIIPNTASRAGYKRLITVLKYVKKIMSPRARNSSENTSPQWLLLTEVCTFVVMSNLQRLLSTMTPDRPHYLGHALSSLGDQDPVPWNQLLAGVVLSRGAVEVLLKAVDEKKFADLGSDTNYHEDALLGRMLGQLDVHPVDTRDSQGYPRFLSLSVQQLFDPLEQAKSKFFWKSSWFHLDQKDVCCSREVTSFRVYNKIDILYLEYAINRLVLKQPTNISRTHT